MSPIPLGGHSGAARPGGGRAFKPCPGGLQQIVCCDVLDDGLVLSPGYGGGPPVHKHKITLFWQSEHRMDNGKPYLLRKRYTLSADPRATLRLDLEAWRGTRFTSDEEAAQLDVEKLIGINALANVVQNRTRRGLFADVVSLMPCPKSKYQWLEVRDYRRFRDRRPGDADYPGAGAGDEPHDGPPDDEPQPPPHSEPPPF